MVRPAPIGRRRVPSPRPRPLPRPGERLVVPEKVAGSGWSEWVPGPTALPFEFAVPDPAHGEFYAATFVHLDRRRSARVVFDCDETAALYINNRQAVRQGYDEGFVHWLEFAEHDEYAGLRRGQGFRTTSAEVELGKGWNSVGVVVYDPGRSWGFALRLEDPRTGKALPAEFSPDLRHGDPIHWQIVIDQLCPYGRGAIPEVFGPNPRTFPDPAHQWVWEEQTPTRRAPGGAAALVAGRRGKGPMRLPDGRFVTFDFGRVVVGHVELEVEGPPGTLLDLLWTEGLGPDDRVDPTAGGLRRADRLVLRRGRQTVRLLGRRAFRFLTLWRG